MNKRVQMFLHEHSTTITVILLAGIILLSFFNYMSQSNAANRANEQRQEDIQKNQEANKAVLEAIKAESETQTEIMNRQFRAICLIMIETVGKEGLNKLDAETRERCENLDAIPEEAAQTEPRQAPDNTPPNNTSASPSSLPNNTPNNTTPQPDNSQNPPEEPEPPQSILPLVDEPIIGCQFGLCI